MRIPPLLEPLSRKDFPISFPPQEATFTVPKNPNDGPQDRMEKLEAKIDNHIAETQKLDRNLATLEPKIDYHTGELQKLDRHLDSLRALLEERTSASRTVTWTQLGGLLLVILLPLGGAFYRYALPQRIENVVSASNSLNMRLGAIIDDKLKPTGERVNSLDGTIKGINEKLDLVISVVRPTVNRKSIVSSLGKETSGDRSSLTESLPWARNLLTVVKKMKVPLERKDYKDISKRLFDHYVSAKEPLKGELWATLLEAASARSVTEAKVHPVADTVVRQAKESGNYFEGAVDLSSRPSWKNAVFANCTINISKPEDPIVLEAVRFINCDFQGEGKNAADRDLLTAFLETTLPTVSATLGPKAEVTYSLSSPKSRRPEGDNTH